MPNIEEQKTVDIDTSGPGAEIDVTEPKDESVVETDSKEQETVTKETNEETNQDNSQSADASEKSDEQPAVQDSEVKKEDDKLVDLGTTDLNQTNTEFPDDRTVSKINFHLNWRKYFCSSSMTPKLSILTGGLKS